VFLKSIRLENVRCFDALELDFTTESDHLRKWTMILAENGCGKSTLLKSIALVTAGSEALAHLLGEPDGWIKNGESGCEIEAVLCTQEGEERSIGFRIDREQSFTDVLLNARDQLDPLERALKHTTRNYFVCGYGASRRMSQARALRSKQRGFHDVRASSVATLFDAEAMLNPLDSWAMDLDYTREDGLQVVSETLSEFLPGVSFAGIDKDKGRLMFSTEHGDVPLQYLSDGYQNVAAWIGDLLYRVTETFDDYKAPLKAHGLLLLDEIDLHLHVKWQRLLVDFLSNRLPNLQIVATTHSPMTAQQMGEGELFSLHHEDKHIVYESFKGDPRKMLVHQLLLADAFGLESDESMHVQEQRERYDELESKSDLTDSEHSELKDIKDMMTGLRQKGRNRRVLADDEIDLLKEIRSELKSRKGAR